MLSILLFPFAFLYDMVARLRNFLYDIGLKESYSFGQAVISVGNLNVGGTGKTPMIEYLVHLLKKRYSLAILSRGYGRTTHGFLLAEMHDDAATIGDEPFQFYRKYGGEVFVAVCESRVEGITKLTKTNPGVQVILLDDAFQHRAVKPLFSILLTDFSKPFFKDFVLPRGRLRESRGGSARADVLIVTKCNNLSEADQSEFKSSLHRYAREKPVFFSGIQYQIPVSMDGLNKITRDIVLVTGIANSKQVLDYVSSHFNLIHHFRFDDHHDYSLNDIETIQSKVAPNFSVLTTEKDMVKLISPELERAIDKKLWFYLPIETHFLNHGAEFDKLVTEKIELHLKNPLTQNLK